MFLRRTIITTLLLLIALTVFGQRYFIGGSGDLNWNDTNNWSTSSGGAGGASVPITTDNVYFDANSLSGSCTLTLDAAAECLDLDFTGLDDALTLSAAVYTMSVYGSLTLPASNLTTAFTGTGYLYFKATTSETITSNGTSYSWNRIHFSGVGGTLTNQDDWDVGTSTIFPQTGSTWTTNNFNIDTGGFTIWGGIVNFGSSQITLHNGNFQKYGGTINAGTSTIILSGITNSFLGGGATYYNLEMTGRIQYISGANTFNNLTKTALTSFNTITFSVQANQTINGTLTITGQNASNYRLLVYSNSPGTPRILTAANVSISNCDFRDITGAGAGDWDFSSEEIGDCGGNSGITFRTGEDRYWFENTGSYHDLNWFSETNGGGVSKGMPLPQDNAVFDANSFSAEATLTIANPRIGSIDMSGVDEAVTVSSAINMVYYGHFILGSNITYSGAVITYLYGRSSYNLSPLGARIYRIYIYAGSSGTYTLQSDLYTSYESTSKIALSIQTGIFDLNDFNVSSFKFYVYSTVYLGSGEVEIRMTSGTGWYPSGTINAESSTIIFNPALGAGLVNFNSRGRTYNNIRFINGGTFTGQFQLIEGNSSFNNITIDPGQTLKIEAGTIQSLTTLTAIGTSGNEITITSSTAATHTLSVASGTIPVQYCDISYSTATGGATFEATNSTDSGNNTGWTFLTSSDQFPSVRSKGTWTTGSGVFTGNGRTVFTTGSNNIRQK